MSFSFRLDPKAVHNEGIVKPRPKQLKGYRTSKILTGP